MADASRSQPTRPPRTRRNTCWWRNQRPGTRGKRRRSRSVRRRWAPHRCCWLSSRNRPPRRRHPRVDSTRCCAVSDLDANGVVIALMTPVVNSLTTKAACSASGGAYIAGFFFPADLDPNAPAFQTNRGEIFYSVVADPNHTVSCAHTAAQVKTGTLGTFAHEFQHMINFAQHTLIQGGTVSEEGWLDEGLSQYAEELTARRYLQAGDTTTFSRLAINDVFDAYQYLSTTGAAALLIEFDQGTQAERGASWLFARYIVDQYGAGLPAKLVQTTL